MIKSPVFLAAVLLLAALIAVGYQAFELNKVRLGNMGALNKSPQKIDSKKTVTVENYIPTLEQLSKRDLLGNPKKIVAQPSADKAIPMTALKLTLIGTISKTEGGRSSAMIQGSNRETKRYYVGEAIEAGFTLDSVAVDSVVLKRDQQLETLQYPKNDSTAVMSAVAQPIRQPVVVNRPAQQNVPAVAKPAGAKNNMISLRDRLRRAKSNNNPQQNSGDQQ